MGENPLEEQTAHCEDRGVNRLLAILALMAVVIGVGCAAPAYAPPADRQAPAEQRPGTGSMM